MLQSLYQKVFRICWCHDLWVCSIFLSTSSWYCICVCSSFTVYVFACTCFSWFFASATWRYFSQMHQCQYGCQLKISESYTLIAKKYVSESVPVKTVLLFNHQHFPLILMFPLPFEKVNNLALIIIFQTLFPMIILTHSFVSLLILLFRVYTEVLWGGFIGAYLEAGHEWNGSSDFSRNLRVAVGTHRCYYFGMSLGLYFEVSRRWISGSL